MSITYHHYGAGLIHAPIDQLRRDMQEMLGLPASIARGDEHAASTAAAVVAAPHNAHAQKALRPAATALLEQAPDGSAATYTLSYRPPTRAPGLVDYSITCTLQCLVDAPDATFVEWMRAYRPAAPICQVQTFASELAAQDRAIAARLAARYSGAEVMYMDYTLGRAGAP